MRPITKPLPGPVASEGAQMTSAQRDAVVLRVAIAAHRAAKHPGDIHDCARGCLVPVRYQNGGSR